MCSNLPTPKKAAAQALFPSENLEEAKLCYRIADLPDDEKLTALKSAGFNSWRHLDPESPRHAPDNEDMFRG